MEAKGMDDAQGWHPWSNLGFSSSPYSIGSSSSSEGTIASTGYTFTGSHVSSISTEASMAMYLLVDYYASPEQMEMKRKRMHSMVLEFFGAPLAQRNSKTNSLRRKLLGAQSVNRGILERWLAELGVGWVLHLAAGGGGAAVTTTLESWIRALAEITETIRLALASLFPVPDRGSLQGLPSISEDKAEEPEAAKVSGSKATSASPPDQFQYAQFIHETMSEMLAFVDVIVAPNATDRGGTQQQQYGQLSTLLRVHDALSRALAKIRLSFHSSSTAAQVQRMQSKTVRLLSAREAKVGEATWSTLEHIRTRVLESIENDGVVDSSDSQILQGSPDIYRATRSVARHISFLRSHYSPVNAVVSEAASLGKYVPQIGVGDLFPLNSMIVELASCLEEKLVNVSKSFPDQAIGFLFLLNNLYFIRERLLFFFLLKNSDFICGSPQTYSSLDIHVATLFDKVEGYIESYLLVSWAPVLSCLFDPTPLCFGKRHYSPLLKFESEFQKTYTTQKLWKVPDPQLRKMLREAIIEKITPVYRKYIGDNNVTAPKLTPRELQEMLQELFEG